MVRSSIIEVTHIEPSSFNLDNRELANDWQDKVAFKLHSFTQQGWATQDGAEDRLSEAIGALKSLEGFVNRYLAIARDSEAFSQVMEATVWPERERFLAIDAAYYHELNQRISIFKKDIWNLRTDITSRNVIEKQSSDQFAEKLIVLRNAIINHGRYREGYSHPNIRH